MKEKKEKMIVSYPAKVKRETKKKMRLIGTMLKRLKMMANKIKARKSKAKNRMNQAMINKKEIIPINKSSNGTQTISNKSSSNNKRTLKKNPKVNKPQKLNK